MHHGLRLPYPTAQIPALDIHQSPAIDTGVFRLDHGRPLVDPDIRHIGQRDTLAIGCHHRQQAHLLHRIPVTLGIAQIDGIALQTLHRVGHVHAANRGTYDRLNVCDIQPETSGSLALYIHLDVASAGHPLGKRRGCAGYVSQHPLELFPYTLDHRQVRTGHLDADWGLDARGEHVDAGFDRHDPGVSKARKSDGPVQFPAQRFRRHAGSPLVPWFELDKGLNHGQRGRIGGRIGAANFSEHGLHFRNTGNQLVGLLQNLSGLANGDTRIGGGHVHQIPLVQRRHEFTAQLVGRPEADDQHHQASGKHQCRPSQSPADNRSVQGDQQSVDGIAMFWQYLATDEIAHQHWNESDGQPGCRRHGVGFGERQGGEELALLSLQGEDRQKAHGDDHQ